MRKQCTVELKVLCKQLRREVQCQLQRAYWTYLNTTFEDAESEQATKNKLFWTYIKHQKSSNVRVAHWRKKDALFRTPKSRLKYSRGSSSWRTAKGGHSPKKSSMRSAVGPPSTSLQLTRSPLCTRCEKTVLQPQPGQSSWPKQHQPSCLERTSRGGSSHSDAHIPVIGRHWLVTSGLERCTCDTSVQKTGTVWSC